MQQIKNCFAQVLYNFIQLNISFVYGERRKALVQKLVWCQTKNQTFAYFAIEIALLFKSIRLDFAQGFITDRVGIKDKTKS